MVSTKREVVIVGAGGAGGSSALELARNGWKVTLVDKDKLLAGSSSRTPGRMSLGFHYVDLKTSLKLLKATIRFTKTFPGFRVGEDLEWSHRLRHGRYFIMKDSMFSVATILSVYEAIKEEYRQMVEDDPSNEVYGPPEDFCRIMDQTEYENDVDVDKVLVGIETPEHLLDWPTFETHFVQLIRNHDNIVIHEYMELVDVKKQESKNGRFALTFKSGNANEYKCIVTDYVINSTWSEIERLNALAGFNKMPDCRTNRLKVLLDVELPDSMLDVNSMFFCMGPFCMFSNLGNGRAAMTYADVTNIENSTELSMSSRMARLLNEGPTIDEYEYYSSKMLEGCASYIPGLKQAKIAGLRFGIVQIHGDVHLYDVGSSYHGRAYYGVRTEGPGWISNPGMKLLYLLENGKAASEILEQHFEKDNFSQ